jgi:hypothetical protein
MQVTQVQAAEVHVQVLLPILLGPHSVVQSWSVPCVHASVVVTHVSRHAFPVSLELVSAQVVPSPEQTSPAQQGWFASPQALHWPFEHTALVAVQRLPVQQDWSAWPHGAAYTSGCVSVVASAFAPESWLPPPVPPVAGKFKLS